MHTSEFEDWLRRNDPESIHLTGIEIGDQPYPSFTPSLRLEDAGKLSDLSHALASTNGRVEPLATIIDQTDLPVQVSPDASFWVGIKNAIAFMLFCAGVVALIFWGAK